MLYDIETECKSVKTGLFDKRFVLGSKWYPIASEWFERWKLYVNFDEIRSPNESAIGLEPGPIDNSSLRGNYEEELKAELIEGLDYVLLPQHSYIRLQKHYGGGPDYRRDVINIGTIYSPILQVNLYPIRFEVYHCSEDNTSLDPEDDRRYFAAYFNKNADFDKVVTLIKSKFSLQVTYSVRYWVKEPEEDGMILNTNRIVDPTKETFITSDMTNRDGPWRLFRNDQNLNIRALLGTKDRVEMIIESCRVRMPKPVDWPKHRVLNLWKFNLQCRDVIDAMDKTNCWCEAIVKQYDREAKRLFLHFKGWKDDFDEVFDLNIPSNLLKLEPLHSKTTDRSTWSEGDKVEIKISQPNDKPIWIPATITDVNKAAERVQVEYPKKDKTKALLKYLGDKSSINSPVELTNDDDMIKKISASASSLADAEDAEDGDLVHDWFDLFGETISSKNTHINPIKVSPNRTDSSSGNGVNDVKRITNTPYNVSSSISTIGSTISGAITSTLGLGRSAYELYGDKHTKGTPDVEGAVGLQNLGNTCFMNSILQCVSNTEIITDLFLSNRYKGQINTDNPLGHGGKLVNVFSHLIKDMWSGAYTRIVPRDFKTTIGEFQPQFAGYEQQDSQEFLGFLLDGLHEDLNRVQTKPFVTKIESKGRPDELIACESWRRYLKRNDSEIVDKCFGQLKSHVTCVNCGNESVTFDEYSSLSLPIPIRNTRITPVLVQVLPYGSTPVKLDLELELTATMADLKEKLIDRLIEHNILKRITRGDVSISKNYVALGNETLTSDESPSQPMDTVENTTGNGSDDYELVQYSDIPSGSSVEKAPDPISPSTEDGTFSLQNQDNRVAYDQYFFHFSTTFSSRSLNIWKNYDGDSKSTLVQNFVGRTDNLVAFQLKYETPVYKQGYYSSNYHSVYGSKPEPTEYEKSKYFSIDLCMGWKTPSSYVTDRIELQAPPNRFSVPKKCSNRDAHAIVYEVMKQFIQEDSEYANLRFDIMTHNELEKKLPYELIIANSYASCRKSGVAVNDDVLAITPQEILCVLWNSEQKADEHFDSEQLQRIRDLDALSSNGTDNSADAVKPKLSVFSCLNKFIEREQLHEAETIFCSNCKKHLAPIKKMDIWSAPDVLILHLKRFQYIPGQYFVHREKISELIDFPIDNFDLSEYVIGPKPADAPPIYELYAVSHHMGGLGGGHYTANCKNFKNLKWYNFNDSSVSSASKDDSVSTTSYVLFYKRKTGSLRWGGVVPNPEELSDE